MRYKNEDVDLPAAINKLRKEKNISTYKLADLSGVHVNNIKNFMYRRPNGRLGYAAISRILRALNCSIADIWRVHDEQDRN